MMKYAAVIEKGEARYFETGENNYSAYVPDLPGCVATGKTKDEVSRNVREAIAFHIEGLREDGLPVPEPQTSAVLVEV